MRQNVCKNKQNISILLSFGIYNYGSNSRLTIMKKFLTTTEYVWSSSFIDIICLVLLKIV